MDYHGMATDDRGIANNHSIAADDHRIATDDHGIAMVVLRMIMALPWHDRGCPWSPMP